MTDIAAQTPLPDLLRKVPAGERLTIEHSPTSHSFIPIGRMAHEAAAEIERLTDALHDEIRRHQAACDEARVLRAEVAAYKDAATARDRNEDALRVALHEIAEEWAGAECGEPVHAQEAYAIALAKRMYGIAAAALAAKEMP
jgi:hypothetical protein